VSTLPYYVAWFALSGGAMSVRSGCLRLPFRFEAPELAAEVDSRHER
jgi:hypothetical protein